MPGRRGMGQLVQRILSCASRDRGGLPSLSADYAPRGGGEIRYIADISVLCRDLGRCRGPQACHDTDRRVCRRGSAEIRCDAGQCHCHLSVAQNCRSELCMGMFPGTWPKPSRDRSVTSISICYTVVVVLGRQSDSPGTSSRVTSPAAATESFALLPQWQAAGPRS